MSDEFIGRNVARERRRRGLSQKVLAELSGLSQGYISLLERGQRPIDRRSTVVRLAEALRVSVAELTGQPYAPTDPAHERARGAVPAIRAELVALAYGDAAPKARRLDAVATDAQRLSDLRRACDYATAAPLAALVLRELRAHAATGDRGAMRLLTIATHEAASIVKYLGYADLAYMAAERGSEVAGQLKEPAYVGLAAYSRLQMLPPENRPLGGRLAAASLDLPGLTSTPEAQSTYGMIHLVSAYADALAGKESDAFGHLSDAAEVARAVGEGERPGGFAGLNFGPTNVTQWRITITIETGNPGRAVELAAGLNPAMIASASRRAAFHIDRGNALAQTRRDSEAVAAFLAAENIAPQRVRLTTTVRETVGTMLRRSRAKAGGTQLQALAARLGAA